MCTKTRGNEGRVAPNKPTSERVFAANTDVSSDQSMIKVAESAYLCILSAVELLYRSNERDQILQSRDHNQALFFFEGQSVAFGLEGTS